jgi:hypothetical protein
MRNQRFRVGHEVVYHDHWPALEPDAMDETPAARIHWKVDLEAAHFVWHQPASRKFFRLINA